MKKFIVSLVVFIGLSYYLYAEPIERLFIIERSKNANIVCYDANLTAEGNIDKKDPVEAYWLLYAEKKGAMEKLSTFDKKAYGYKVKYNEEKKNYDFILKAVDDKPMTINMYGNRPKVTIKINDKDCFLDKVYIQSKDGAFGIPKVSYYVLYGYDVSTDAAEKQQIDVK